MNNQRKQYYRKYYLKNREKINEKNKLYYKNNKDKIINNKDEDLKFFKTNGKYIINFD